MKKNLEILQKVVRYYFIPNQDQTNPFSILWGGIKLLFKHYLALFVVSVVTRYHFF